MNEPILTPVIFGILMIILIIAGALTKTDLSARLRQKQVEDASKSNDRLLDIIKKRTDKKVKYSKRTRVEATMHQAGLKWKYEKFYLCKIISSVSLFSLGLLTGNIPLSISLGFCGIALPYQLIVFVKNRRAEKLEKQIGPFLQMTAKRYISTKNMEKALISTRDNMVGIEPLHNELMKTTADIEAKKPIYKALEALADRTQNKFLKRFANFYKIASETGSEETRKLLINQASEQFEEDRKMKGFLKTEIAEPKGSAKIVLAMIPGVVIYGIFVLNGYTDFIQNTLLGQLLISVDFLCMVGTLWLINTKIGGPLD